MELVRRARTPLGRDHTAQGLAPRHERRCVRLRRAPVSRHGLAYAIVMTARNISLQSRIPYAKACQRSPGSASGTRSAKTHRDTSSARSVMSAARSALSILTNPHVGSRPVASRSRRYQLKTGARCPAGGRKTVVRSPAAEGRKHGHRVRPTVQRVMPLSDADGHHGRGGSLVPADSSVDVKGCVLGRAPLVRKLVLELLSPHLEAAPRTVRQRRWMRPFGATPPLDRPPSTGLCRSHQARGRPGARTPRAPRRPGRTPPRSCSTPRLQVTSRRSRRVRITAAASPYTMGTPRSYMTSTLLERHPESRRTPGSGSPATARARNGQFSAMGARAIRGDSAAAGSVSRVGRPPVRRRDVRRPLAQQALHTAEACVH